MAIHINLSLMESNSGNGWRITAPPPTTVLEMDRRCGFPPSPSSLTRWRKSRLWQKSAPKLPTITPRELPGLRPSPPRSSWRGRGRQRRKFKITLASAIIRWILLWMRSVRTITEICPATVPCRRTLSLFWKPILSRMLSEMPSA